MALEDGSGHPGPSARRVSTAAPAVSDCPAPCRQPLTAAWASSPPRRKALWEGVDKLPFVLCLLTAGLSEHPPQTAKAEEVTMLALRRGTMAMGPWIKMTRALLVS